jgi:hypothetical protein
VCLIRNRTVYLLCAPVFTSGVLMDSMLLIVLVFCVASYCLLVFVQCFVCPMLSVSISGLWQDGGCLIRNRNCISFVTPRFYCIRVAHRSSFLCCVVLFACLCCVSVS